MASFSVAHINRATALLELGRGEDALAGYDRALALAPNAAELHLARGSALKALGRLDEALASADRAVELKPERPQPHKARAALLAALGRAEEARAAREQAAALEAQAAAQAKAQGGGERTLTSPSSFPLIPAQAGIQDAISKSANGRPGSPLARGRAEFVSASLGKLRHRRRRLHLGQMKVAAASASSSWPHCDICQSSSTWAAAQAAATSSAPPASASASSAEPVSAVIEASAPSRHGSVRDRRARGGDCFRRLRHMHDALRQHETRAEGLMRPGEHRVPALRLALDQAGRRLGAVEQQIAAEIVFDLGGDRLRPLGHRIDHRIGQPRQRHARRIDDLGLRIPFARRVASASPRAGAASGRRAGVWICLPSSSTGKRARRPRPRRLGGRSACAKRDARRGAPTPSGRAAGSRKSR